jgi:MYXO-CTERM domain-containing protein
MKTLHALLAAGAVAAVAMTSMSADAALIAGWTLPCAFPTGTGNVPTGTFYRAPLAVNGDGTFNANPNTAGTTPWDPTLAGRADMGDMKLAAGFELSSTHQLASSGANATSYTSPAGNGSAYAFSSNVWKAGDWYQAAFITTGYTGIGFSFDMTRSSTGPATWLIEMSTNGGTSFSTLVATYTPIVAGAAGSGTTNWSSTTNQAAFTTSINLDATADDATSVIVRIRALVDSVNGSGVYQAGGTARIDNIMVNGSAVPAPGALALAGLAGIAGVRRRR